MNHGHVHVLMVALVFFASACSVGATGGAQVPVSDGANCGSMEALAAGGVSCTSGEETLAAGDTQVFGVVESGAVAVPTEVRSTPANGGFFIQFDGQVTAERKNYLNFNHRDDDFLRAQYSNVYTEEVLAGRGEALDALLDGVLLDGRTIRAWCDETFGGDDAVLCADYNGISNRLIVRFAASGLDYGNGARHSVRLAEDFVLPSGRGLPDAVLYTWDGAEGGTSWRRWAGGEAGTALCAQDFAAEIGAGRLTLTVRFDGRVEAAEAASLYGPFVRWKGRTAAERLAAGEDLALRAAGRELTLDLALPAESLAEGSYGRKSSLGDEPTLVVERGLRTPEGLTLVADAAARLTVVGDRAELSAERTNAGAPNVEFVGVAGPGREDACEFRLLFAGPFAERKLPHLNAFGDWLLESSAANGWGYLAGEIAALEDGGAQDSVWHKLLFNGESIWELMMREEDNWSQTVVTVTVHADVRSLTVSFADFSLDSDGNPIPGKNHISPDERNQPMTWTVCAGFVAPAGGVVARDTTFTYDPGTWRWLAEGEAPSPPHEDVTIEEVLPPPPNGGCAGGAAAVAPAVLLALLVCKGVRR